MKALFLAATLALRFHGVSAVPQKYSLNSTAISPPWPGVTRAPVANCSNHCTYDPIVLWQMTWSQLDITATYTAETVVVIVNKKTNTTRTTTISNTEVDFSNITTPTNLNSDGTVTASVIDNDGSTRVVAYPTTLYSDYPNGQSWTGTLSTTINGTPTCSIAPTGAVAAFPSHPLLPEGVQDTGVNMIEDPRGWTFIPDFEEAGLLGPSNFPGLGVWNCSTEYELASPVGFIQTALYLTKTSTSTESDNKPTSITAPSPSTQPQTATTGAPNGLLSATGLLPTTTRAAAVDYSTTSTVNADSTNHLPAIQILSVVSNPSTAASESIIITASPVQTTTLPTTPVAVQVPVTSTDSKGSITIVLAILMKTYGKVPLS